MKDILVENAGALLNDYTKIQLPEEYSIFDVSKGILNNDDVWTSLLSLKTPGLTYEDRQLYVLLSNEQNGYDILSDKNDLVLGSEDGGPFGDPYSGTKIENKTLEIKNYGGSSDRWGTTEKFKMIDGRLKLVEERILAYSNTTASGEIKIIDFLEKTSKTYSVSETNKDGEHLLDSKSIRVIEDVYFDEKKPEKYYEIINEKVFFNKAEYGEKGALYLGMPMEEVERVLNEMNVEILNEIEITSHPDDWNYGNKEFWMKDYHIEFDKKDNIYEIYVHGNIPTERGLKIGDPIEKMEELYGENYKKSTDGGETRFRYDMGDYKFWGIFSEDNKLKIWALARNLDID